MNTVDLRCPVDTRRLFARMKIDPTARIDRSSNLLEIGCADCRRQLRRAGETVDLVVHRFDAAGDLIETAVDGRVTRPPV